MYSHCYSNCVYVCVLSCVYVQDVAVDVDVVQDIHHVRKQNARTPRHNAYTYVAVAEGKCGKGGQHNGLACLSV